MSLPIEVNEVTIGAAVAIAYPIAYAIAKMTRTKKDDKVVDIVGKILNFVFPFTGPKGPAKKK